MNREEVKIYLKRQEEKLAEMKDYEKALAIQIEIEEANLSPEAKLAAREDLKKNARIKELEKKVAELTDKLGLQEEKKERIKEITSYREREEGKLKEVLSYKEPLLKQKQKDEKEAEEAKAKKEEILRGIADKIFEANNEIEVIKAQKQNYVLSLNKREKDLTVQAQKIADSEMELAARMQEGIKAKNQYTTVLNEVKAERERLINANLLTNVKRKELDEKSLVLEKQLKTIAQMEAKTKDKLAEISKEKYFITQQSGLLKLDKEAADKKVIELDKRQAAMEREAIHMESQRQQLRSAKEEFEKKGII